MSRSSYKTDRGFGFNLRGRGRGRGGSSWSHSSTQEEVVPPPPVGDLIQSIPLEELTAVASGNQEMLRITNTEVVASYNWIRGSVPRIMIPGKPPRWTPPKTPQQLSEDSGTFYRDRNAAGFPKHPMEPAVMSIMESNASPVPVEVFACNHTLINLWRYTKAEDRAFRMLIEVVGGTVHLIRRENSPTETIPGVRGYGHTFPEAYTTWEPDVKSSSSYQRILKYEFGGMQMMVRFEGDGYIPKDTATQAATPAITEKSNEALDAFENLLINERVTPQVSGKLEVQHGGSTVAQDTIFDLKTRSTKQEYRDTLGEELPRLWVAQISKFVLAHHSRGLFSDVKVSNVSERVKEWEKDNQPSLQRLAALLQRIVKVAMGYEDTKLELVRRDGGTLEIRRRLPDTPEAFSSEVSKRWEDWLGDGTGLRDNAESETAEGGVEVNAHHTDDEHKDSAGGDGRSSGDDEDEPDYTACDIDCGYCGKCDH